MTKGEIWDDKQKERLLEVNSLNKYSLSQMAEIMNSEFGTKRTRNSIVRKLKDNLSSKEIRKRKKRFDSLKGKGDRLLLNTKSIIMVIQRSDGGQYKLFSGKTRKSRNIREELVIKIAKILRFTISK